MAIDNFQLPPPPDKLPESYLDFTNRKNLLSPIVEHFWTELVGQLGHEEALRLWQETIRQKKRKRGAPKKQKLKNEENLFLIVYDRMLVDPNPETLIRFLSHQFYKELRGKKGFPTREAVEKRIRRVLELRLQGRLEQVPSAGAIPQYKIIPDDGH